MDVAQSGLAMERLLGYHTKEVVGAHAAHFFAPEDRAAGRPESELKKGGGRRPAPMIAGERREPAESRTCVSTLLACRSAPH